MNDNNTGPLTLGFLLGKELFANRCCASSNYRCWLKLGELILILSSNYVFLLTTYKVFNGFESKF